MTTNYLEQFFNQAVDSHLEQFFSLHDIYIEEMANELELSQDLEEFFNS